MCLQLSSAAIALPLLPHTLGRAAEPCLVACLAAGLLCRSISVAQFRQGMAMLGDDLDGATVRQAPAGSICPAGPAWQPGSHITTPSCRSAQTALLPTSPRLCPPAHLPALPLLPAWPVLALQVALALDAMDVHGFLEEHQFRDIVEAEQLNSKSQVATLWRHHLHNQRGGQRA